MTWTTFGKTDIGLTAYHLPNDGTGDEKIRLQVGLSYIDLNEKQRRDLAAYLLTQLTEQ